MKRFALRFLYIRGDMKELLNQAYWAHKYKFASRPIHSCSLWDALYINHHYFLACLFLCWDYMNNGIFNKLTYFLARFWVFQLNIGEIGNLGATKISPIILPTTFSLMKRLCELLNLLKNVEYLFIFRKIQLD